MKMRALLLTCLLIGGVYAMIQSIEEFQVKGFHEILPVSATSVEQLVFTSPASVSSAPPAWTVTDKEEIDRLMAFLQTVEVRKVDAQQPLHDLDFNQFTITLEDNGRNRITILADDHLIVTEEGEQFAVVDETLDVSWLLRFMISNQLPR